MRILSAPIGSRVWRHLVLLGTLRTLSRALLCEEEEEGESYGLVGEHDPDSEKYRPAGLLEHEGAYLENVTESIAAYSRMGKRRLQRFHVLTVGAVVCASAVPVAVVAGLAGWCIAALGAFAAVAQGTQQILRDQELGTECHVMAVRLGAAVRKMRFEAGATTRLRQRKVFQDFVAEVEVILAEQGTVLLEHMKPSSVLDEKD